MNSLSRSRRKIYSNLRGKIENESYNYYEKKKMFKAVLKAIWGKLGVPSDEFTGILEVFLYK